MIKDQSRPTRVCFVLYEVKDDHFKNNLKINRHYLLTDMTSHEIIYGLEEISLRCNCDYN